MVEYHDSDAVGSIRVVTGAQGQVVARHDFLPFGEELNPQHGPPDKRLYTGQERDFETGQDYFGYRQLRTDLGRFLAPDPITLVPRVVGAQGVNSYAYVRNNPLRLIDPNGLDARALENLPIQYTDGSPTDLPSGSVVGLIGETNARYEEDAERAAEVASAESLAAQVPGAVKTGMEDSVAASNNATIDKPGYTGGFAETGGIWGKDATGNAVPVPCVPGAVADPAVKKAAEIDMGNSADPAQRTRLSTRDGQWHVHPSGVVWKGDKIEAYFNQGVSGYDKEHAASAMNVVIAARDKRVYFYGPTGRPVSIGFKRFFGR